MQGILTEDNEKRIGKSFDVIKSKTLGQASIWVNCLKQGLENDSLTDVFLERTEEH